MGSSLLGESNEHVLEAVGLLLRRCNTRSARKKLRKMIDNKYYFKNECHTYAMPEGFTVQI